MALSTLACVPTAAALLLLLCAPAASECPVGAVVGSAAGGAAKAPGPGETCGSIMLQKASTIGSRQHLALEEEEAEEAGRGAEPSTSSEEPLENTTYYQEYLRASGWAEEPANGTNESEGGSHDAPPEDINYPPGWLPMPVPCVTYNLSHPLVEKQFKGEMLSYEETQRLIQGHWSFGHASCMAAPGTQVIHTRTHKHMCIQKDQPYTVCFTGNPNSHVMCGIFVAGARGQRKRGGVDCLGGCNEGSSACNVLRHRGSCFTHDVCSLVLDATGFMSHRECGDEAAAAVHGAGRCGGTGRW